MNITENQFRLNALNFDQQRSNLSDQKELLSFDQEAQDYANSPLSYGLSIGAGALNGLAVGSSFLSAADTLSSFAAPAATQAFASPNSKTQTTMWDPKGGSLFGQNSLLAPKVPVGTSGWAGTTGDFSGAQNFGTLQGFDLNGSSNLWQSPLLTKLRKTKSLLGGL